MLFEKGFQLIRTKGSHRIYLKDENRIVIPFHSGKTLHPKIIKQVIKAIE
jgi:predicted RNA binding protein YcfA (HicA-like mRNA interferase family)